MRALAIRVLARSGEPAIVPTLVRLALVRKFLSFNCELRPSPRKSSRRSPVWPITGAPIPGPRKSSRGPAATGTSKSAPLRRRPNERSGPFSHCSTHRRSRRSRCTATSIPQQPARRRRRISVFSSCSRPPRAWSSHFLGKEVLFGEEVITGLQGWDWNTRVLGGRDRTTRVYRTGRLRSVHPIPGSSGRSDRHPSVTVG